MYSKTYFETMIVCLWHFAGTSRNEIFLKKKTVFLTLCAHLKTVHREKITAQNACNFVVNSKSSFREG